MRRPLDGQKKVMTSFDPMIRLTSTYAVDDLREFVERTGPFASVVLPSASEHPDAAQRHQPSGRTPRPRARDT